MGADAVPAGRQGVAVPVAAVQHAALLPERQAPLASVSGLRAGARTTGAACAGWAACAGAGVAGVGAAGAGAAGRGAAASTSGFSSGRENLRFFVSTTTAFVRPWLKFWRTVLCSTPGRFMVSVFFVLTLSVLSSFVLSLITFPFPSRLRPLSSFIQRDQVRLDKAPVIRLNAQSDPEPAKPLQSCALIQVRCAFIAIAMQHKRPLYEPGRRLSFKYGCMYHISAPKCQIHFFPVKRVKEGISGPSRCTTARRA